MDPTIIHWLSWAGTAYILWLALKIATSPATNDGLQSEPISFWASFGLQFVNVKIILYGITALSTFVLPYTQDAHWVDWREYSAGVYRYLRQCMLGAGGPSFSACFSPLRSATEYHSGITVGVLCGEDFLLTNVKKRKTHRPLPLSDSLLGGVIPREPYRLSVKVRAITSRCCSGVRELKRTA
ncbi:Cysteine/O-acetylserine efflux protein [Citrobacter freundii]|nr:Cysteine/O-acetylserine efflux protein [Citrobacter freundii]